MTRPHTIWFGSLVATAIALLATSPSTLSGCPCSRCITPTGPCERNLAEGWLDCEVVAGQCSTHTPCACPEGPIPGTTEFALSDGTVIMGEALDNDVTVVRGCQGTRIAVLYTAHGANARRDLARAIRLE